MSVHAPRPETAASGAVATDGSLSTTWPLLFARNLFLPPDLGGNRYPYEVVRRFGQRGHPTTVVTPRLHGQFPRLQGVRYWLYPVSRRHPLLTHATNVLGAHWVLRRHAATWPSVALSGSYDSALALRFAGIVPRTPLVFTYHSEFYSEWVQALGNKARESLPRRLIRQYMAAVERRVFGLAARIVAVSEFSARQIHERSPEHASRVRVIPTGVDTAYFTPAEDGALAKRALGLDPGRSLVLGVGRLVGVKQFDRLIDGFALATARGLDAHLAIAGGGPEQARLAQQARRLGLSARVTVAGYCDPPALRAWMQAADLQVCSSAFENLSLAILEGLACGTPVLGTPGGGTSELVGAIDPCLVLADDRAETIGAGILAALQDLERLRALGQRGRRLAEARYDWERVVDQLEALCAEVML